jgi:hypothetical protein
MSLSVSHTNLKVAASSISKILILIEVSSVEAIFKLCPDPKNIRVAV